MEELRRMRGGHDQNLQAQGGQLGQGNGGVVPGIKLVPELQTMGIRVGGHQAPEIPRNINIAPGIPEIPIFGNLDGLQGRNPIPEGQMGGIPRGRGQEAMIMEDSRFGRNQTVADEEFARWLDSMRKIIKMENHSPDPPRSAIISDFHGGSCNLGRGTSAEAMRMNIHGGIQDSRFKIQGFQ
ncbi:hypothetical protein O6P43_006300 [Quillaja saponaria]|uniref:Uncharacterized protein n=1 Tax=Quillaja saponaria TaxID=32244 RepID=A0AAD7Q7X1_QUISA|nr:hypothetical protein O6P43_006300 [Quillaja saponaria]